MSSVALATATLEGAVTHLNQAFLDLWGFSSAEEVLNLPLGGTGDAGVAGGGEVLAALLADGEWEGELAATRADGEAFTVGVAATVVRDDRGEPFQVVVTCEDVSALRRAEQAREENEARLQGVLDNLQDAYLLAGADGNLTYVSRSTLTMFGYESAEELLGRPAEVLYAAHDIRERLLGALLRDGRVHDFLAEGRRKDGSTFWGSMNVQLLRDEDGAIKGTEGVVRDISTRMETARALGESERRLDELATQSRTVTWEVDQRGLYTYVSHVSGDVFGYEPEELVGKLDFSDIHPEDQREAVRAAAREVMTRREPFVGFESAAVTKDGRLLWTTTNGIPLLDADGALRGYRGSTTDITERRHIEDELRTFRRMVDGANYGAAAAAMDGTLTYVNGTMAAMHGWTVEELTDRHLSVCHTEEQLADVGRLLGVIAEQGGFEAEVVWHVRRDGSVFPTLMNAFTLPGVGGSPELHAVTMIDISDRYAAEEEIRTLNASLERRVREATADLRAANAELESFSYAVSHDLRGPLRAVDGFCQILHDDYGGSLDDEARGYLDRVRAAAQKMARLIDDLLSLSRLSRKEVRNEEVDVGAVAEQVLAQLRMADPFRRVETVVAEGCTTQTDRGLLVVLLENLLGNAWKFSSRRETAHIEFGEAEVDGLHAYFVRDDGAGFDPAYAGKLFGPFQRLHGEDEFPGHGIGLATVRRVASRLGGRCWGEGRLGEGATFYFTLGEPEA